MVAWRGLVAAGLVASGVAGALVVGSGCGRRGGFAPESGGPTSLAHPAAVAAQPSSCRIPVVTLSMEKGNTYGGGFLTLPAGTYETDPSSGHSYDWPYRRWLPVEPELIAPDGSSYVQADGGGGISVVDVASGSRRVLLPPAARGSVLWGPRRFAAEGIYVESGGLGPGLSLLTLDGALTPVAGSRTWYVIGPDAAWSYNYSNDPDQSVYRLDLRDHSVTAWYHPPAGTKRMFVPAVDTAGRPFVMFRGDPSTPWRMGLVTGRDTLAEATPPPGMGAATGFGIGLSDSRGIWLGIDGVGLLLYGPDGSLRLASAVPSNVLRAAGPCQDIGVETSQPPPPTTRPTAPAAPPATAPPDTPPPPPAPPRFAVNVPIRHQESTLSCEEASLAMVLAFYGHPTTEKQVFDQVGIDTVHSWAGRSGGGDPYQEFVGNPNGSEVQQTGYGVYWPPIRAAAAHFGAPVAQASEGIPPAAIYAAVRAGHPAVVWVTYDLRPHTRSDYVAYDGRTILYAGPFEHTMVVTGLSDTGVRVNDPDAGQYWVPIGQFEAAYAVYDQMAVVFG